MEKTRKSNISSFGIVESKAIKAKYRIQDDMVEVEESLKSIRIKGKVKQLT